ncbi:hypothetical protein KCU65_g2842, partial [Aureobasidium melanogenum]
MYHHANTNINPSQSPDHDTKSSKSSETRRKQIPLAFTNTEWGKEYAANPNWEHENLGRCNPTVRKGSRFRSEPDPKVNKSTSVSTPSHAKPEMGSAKPSADSSSSTTVPLAPSKPAASSQEYSVMVAWNFFRRTFPPNISPTTPNPAASDQKASVHPQPEEGIAMGPWLEMLMRWDDFEQWRLTMLDQPWYLLAAPEEL